MAFEDYYLLLGVSRHATTNDIRAAYRKMVLEFHPDRHPDDPSAEEKFKQLGIAYQTLSSDKERIRYDIKYDDFRQAQKRQEISAAATAPAAEVPSLKLKPRSRAGFYERSAPLLENRLKVVDGLIGALLGGSLSLLLYKLLADLPWNGLTSPVIGGVSGLLAGAVGGVLSASLGRAFFSSAETRAQKLFGLLVTMGLAFASALLLAPIFSFFVSGFDLSLEFYECMLGSACGAALGGAIAGLLGSRRQLDSVGN